MTASRTFLHIGFGLAMSIGAGLSAAQPAGNPKGTMTPSTQGESRGVPATRNANAGATQRPAGSAAPGRAAEGAYRQPGGGTAGGLAGRHPQGDSGDPKQTRTTDSVPQPKKR